MLKKILFWSGGLFLLFLIATVVLSALFKKEIGDAIIQQTNQSLTTELSVKDFDLDFFGGFPNVSAELLDVTIKDTKGKNLLVAESIGFKLGLLSLFKTKKKIKEVLIENGALTITFDKKGRANYDITKSSNTAESTSNTSIALKEAVLKNIELIYEDKRTEQEAYIVMNDAIFSGEFSADKFALTSNASLISRFVDLGEYRYLVGKNLGYDAKIYVDSKGGFYDFEKLKVKIDDNIFNVDGFADNDLKRNETDFDLIVTCSEGNLGSIIQLLPEQYLKPLNDFSGNGKFLFESKVKGRLSNKTQPGIDTKFILKDGRITSPRLEDDLKDVSFAANFTNGAYRKASSAVFEIKNFKGYFNRELIEMKLKADNLDDPKINFQLDGAVPMESIFKLFNNENITDGDGEIEIHDVKITGKYKDMVSMSRIHRVDASGKFVLDDASLSFKDEEMIFDKGMIAFKDNDLKVTDLKLEGAGSEMIFNGDFENFLPVLLADSLNSKKAELIFDAELVAEEFDGDRLLALSAVSVEQINDEKEIVDSLKTEVNEDREFYTGFLNGTFNAIIENFNYNKIEGRNFEGEIAFEDSQIEIVGDAEAMGGVFEIDGTVFVDKEPNLAAKIKCDGIDAYEFFNQTENFGQEVLRAEHVSGALNSRMFIEAFWNEKGEFLYDDLTVLAGVGIENGELKGFEMLEDFSNIIKAKDLRKIKFVDIENWIRVENQKVYLPSMFVRSNAVNLEVSGTHNFEQDIDYNVKVNAGQVLVNRLKPHNSKLDPQPTKRRGWFNLFYKIKGNLEEDYDVKLSKRSVKKALAQSETIKKRIQRELEEQFGNIELIDGKGLEAQKNIIADETPSKPTTSTNESEKDDDEEYIEGF